MDHDHALLYTLDFRGYGSLSRSSREGVVVAEVATWLLLGVLLVAAGITFARMFEMLQQLAEGVGRPLPPASQEPNVKLELVIREAGTSGVDRKRPGGHFPRNPQVGAHVDAIETIEDVRDVLAVMSPVTFNAFAYDERVARARASRVWMDVEGPKE